MTLATPATSTPGSGWADELATYLGPGCFPASHDHLAATLIQRRAPSHLLWHLAALPRSRQFSCLDELVELLARTAPAAHGLAAQGPS